MEKMERLFETISQWKSNTKKRERLLLNPDGFESQIANFKKIYETEKKSGSSTFIETQAAFINMFGDKQHIENKFGEWAELRTQKGTSYGNVLEALGWVEPSVKKKIVTKVSGALTEEAVEKQKLIVGQKPGTQDPRDEFVIAQTSGAVAPAINEAGEAKDNEKNLDESLDQIGIGRTVQPVVDAPPVFKPETGIIGMPPPSNDNNHEDDREMRLLKMVFGDEFFNSEKYKTKKLSPFVMALEPVIKELDQIRRVLSASSDPYITSMKQQRMREIATQNYFNQIELLAGNDDPDAYLPSGLDEQIEQDTSLGGTLVHDLKQEVYGYKDSDFFKEPSLFQVVFGNQEHRVTNIFNDYIPNNDPLPTFEGTPL